MGYRTLINYRAKQKAEIWDRWQRSESLNAIDRPLGRRPHFSFKQQPLATLVEPTTCHVLVRVNVKDTGTAISALLKYAHKLPIELYKSRTWDRDKEMADHQRFTLATDIKVYFCDPQSLWQHGSNENTNG